MNSTEHRFVRNTFAIFGTALLFLAAAYVGIAQEERRRYRQSKYLVG